MRAWAPSKRLTHGEERHMVPSPRGFARPPASSVVHAADACGRHRAHAVGVGLDDRANDGWAHALLELRTGSLGTVDASGAEVAGQRWPAADAAHAGLRRAAGTEAVVDSRPVAGAAPAVTARRATGDLRRWRERGSDARTLREHCARRPHPQLRTVPRLVPPPRCRRGGPPARGRASARARRRPG